MTAQEFINKWMGKPLDTDGFPHWQPYQCVDVIRQYHKEVLKAPIVPGNAINYWYDYPYNPTLQKFYTRIKNNIWDLNLVPKLGDVIVFDAWKGNPFGHISVCSAAVNGLWFTSFDQNWKGAYCTYIAHNYISPRVIGWLRPNVQV